MTVKYITHMPYAYGAHPFLPLGPKAVHCDDHFE